jgi:glycine reductase
LCVPTGRAVTELPKAMMRVATLALKLGNRQPLGSAEAQGYLPRGIRRLVEREKIGAERAIDMIVARLNGRPFTTEIPITSYDRVLPTRPVADLAATRLALVTSGGVVPRGNPDRLEGSTATKWLSYSIAGKERLDAGAFECLHAGFDTSAANDDLNRIVPVDACRGLEEERRIGKLHDAFFVTTGNLTPVASAERFAREIREALRTAEIQAAILTAT